MNLNYPSAQAIALPQGGVESVLATNRVIRNTYMLLSLTLRLFRVDRRPVGRAGICRTRASSLPWPASSACCSPCIR